MHAPAACERSCRRHKPRTMRPDRSGLSALKETVALVVATDSTSPQYLYEPLVLALVELSAFLYDLDHGFVHEHDLVPVMARAKQALADVRAHAGAARAKRHHDAA